MSATTFPAIHTHFNHSTRHHNSHSSPPTLTSTIFTPKSNPRLQIYGNLSGLSKPGYRVPLYCRSSGGGGGGGGVTAGTFDSSSTSSKGMEMIDTVEEVKSDVYSTTMTEAMGASLTYRHELGINYNFIRPDLIVGSCLQTPEDVDKLRNIGVRTIFCLQQDPDLEYFGVDIKAIQKYAQTFTDIEHIRAEIRDFDGYDLRLRLPAVVGILYKAINRNGGVAYTHCTAGMGRAPAVALAYMYWVQGYGLNEAHKLLLSKRSCCPKLDAIKNATADILTDLKKKEVAFKWKNQKSTLVEISGLDVGWGQKIPLKYEKEQKAWTLQRELPEGRYEYKYVVDGEWICNENELLTPPNDDGQVNNYIEVISDDPDSEIAKLRKRLTGDDPRLTSNERLVIRQFLEKVSDDKCGTNIDI